MPLRRRRSPLKGIPSPAAINFSQTPSPSLLPGTPAGGLASQTTAVTYSSRFVLHLSHHRGLNQWLEWRKFPSEEELPSAPLPLPREGGPFILDQSVTDAFPVPGTKLIRAVSYAHSIGSTTAKLEVQVSDSITAYYFLKIITGSTAESKCEGEYEALKAIYAVSPGFAPKPHAWGKLKESEPETYFLLEDFVRLQKQPADASTLAAGLADLHRRSQSPTGHFGFHVRTWHGEVGQNINQWDESWAALFRRHLGHIVEMAMPRMNNMKFNIVCRLTLDQVVPRLLAPLQENGRVLKPSSLHGDCWDGNTATDAQTGDARVFDVCSFYGHNEYDTGNWRAPRHRVSDAAYIECYKQCIPPSEPIEEWSARQLLYSVCFNMGNLINIPGSCEGDVVLEDLTTLCEMFCPQDLKGSMGGLQ